MKRAIINNLAIGVSVWTLFYLSMFALNGFKSSGTVNFPQSLIALIATLIAVAFLIAPLNQYFPRCPTCAVVFVAAVQGYFGALSLSAYSADSGDSIVRLLLNPVGVLLYTLPYAAVIAAIAVCLFRNRVAR